MIRTFVVGAIDRRPIQFLSKGTGFVDHQACFEGGLERYHLPARVLKPIKGCCQQAYHFCQFSSTSAAPLDFESQIHLCSVDPSCQFFGRMAR